MELILISVIIFQQAKSALFRYTEHLHLFFFFLHMLILMVPKEGWFEESSCGPEHTP